MATHILIPGTASAKVAALIVGGVILAACQTTSPVDVAQTAEFRMDRYEEMQRIQGFEQCSQEGLTLDAEARSRASTGAFLNSARKERSPVTIYLTSGVKLSGRVKGFDKYCVVFETNHQEQLIFKHAISTVVTPRGSSMISPFGVKT